MAYYEEDQVARLISNYERWAGDTPIKGAGRMWDEEKIALRDIRLEFRSNFGAFEALGEEAAKTRAALATIASELRFSLRTYHLSSLTFEMQARIVVGVSKSTYHRRLVRGHVDFMGAYLESSSAMRNGR